jgi:biopolymer transport protein ExbD
MKIDMDSSASEARIEIVPLIDVIFCILTFFILAAVGLTRQEGIGVQLPEASTGQAQMREMLVVSLDPAGQIFVEKQPVTKEQLYQLLLQYNRSKPQGVITLSASQTVSYNQVVEVLDLLRSVGGDRVALAVSPTEQPNLLPQNPMTQPLPLPSPGQAQPLNPNLNPGTPGNLLLPNPGANPGQEPTPPTASPQSSP